MTEQSEEEKKVKDDGRGECHGMQYNPADRNQDASPPAPARLCYPGTQAASP